MTPSGESDESQSGSHLTAYIFGAIPLALVLAIFLPHFAQHLAVGGKVFLRKAWWFRSW